MCDKWKIYQCNVLVLLRIKDGEGMIKKRIKITRLSKLKYERTAEDIVVMNVHSHITHTQVH